jgi:hypothetical protein
MMRIRGIPPPLLFFIAGFDLSDALSSLGDINRVFQGWKRAFDDLLPTQTLGRSQGVVRTSSFAADNGSNPQIGQPALVSASFVESLFPR